jgi:pimeloyl-ACP methyl ester carboxylesterase
MNRRQLLTALGIGLISRSSRAGATFDAAGDLRDLRLLDATEAGRRFVLIAPRNLEPGQKLPLAVLLHGLGETIDERLGAYAWVEKYGLGAAWQRLKRPPIQRTSKRGEWTDERLAEVNSELAARPFRGVALACPFMPNPKSAAEIDAYARWIERSLIPRIRSETEIHDNPDRTYLCGVSLGGYVSLEVLSRLPHVFGAWAGVQTAIGAFAAPRYADKIVSGWGGGSHPMLLLTSKQDHWRAASEALFAAFKAKNLAPTYRVIPGPHDQLWLREAGTIEALHWLDRIAR